MANPYEVKISIIERLVATKLLSPAIISDEKKIRLVVSNAAGGNTVVVRAKINGQDDWDTLATVNGDSKSTINVATYDQLQVECTAYASASDFVKVVVSSFNEAGGSTTIDVPAGGTIESEQITFTSSDSSVSIVSDGVSTIDFTATGVGGLSKYVQTFNNTSDWTLNAGNYEITVTAATHGNKANPVIQTFETIGGVDDIIFPVIIRNASNDIILQVTQVPDNRYTGKLIIL